VRAVKRWGCSRADGCFPWSRTPVLPLVLPCYGGLVIGPASTPNRCPWGRSSVGRAPEWHSGGQGFDSPRLHQRNQLHMLRICGVTVTSRSLRTPCGPTRRHFGTIMPRCGDDRSTQPVRATLTPLVCRGGIRGRAPVPHVRPGAGDGDAKVFSRMPPAWPRVRISPYRSELTIYRNGPGVCRNQHRGNPPC
jgi:hypothetical protein